ncbi:unnamed protein product [Rotaria socialis]|uniref:Uncharacterized protein n=1 Tax=Rotaria socialis TaxID=392032 RepID=A0A820SJN9_9BILA|nr:unnamed protein product [Rotaria socialis]CAF4459156.1 unnamed protein product [Rotaria socialis]
MYLLVLRKSGTIKLLLSLQIYLRNPDIQFRSVYIYIHASIKFVGILREKHFRKPQALSNITNKYSEALKPIMPGGQDRSNVRVMIGLAVIVLFGIITFALAAATLGTLNRRTSNLDKKMGSIQDEMRTLLDQFSTKAPAPAPQQLQQLQQRQQIQQLWQSHNIETP